MGNKKFVGKVNKTNPYKIVRDMIGREKEEASMPTPYGALSIREWDGVTVTRRVEFDPEKEGKFVMTDEVVVDEEKYPELVKKLKEAELIEVA